MKKFDISTDDLDGRIEWHRRFDDALKEIICDLHKAESGQRLIAALRSASIS